MLSIDYQDKVAIVKLDRSVTNALNLELVNKLAETFKQIQDDSNVHGLVLSSTNEKFFSIGFDIPELFELNRKEFEHFFRAVNNACLDLYILSKPTVVAITGHATAGGCIMALCCDYRFISEGRKFMGLNEIKLGIPVPYLADCILRGLAGTRRARDVTDTGDFFGPEESLQIGMVDRVLPLEQVLPEAIEKAGELGSCPGEAFAMIKHNRIEIIEKQVRERFERDVEFFTRCWYSEDVRQRLREAMETF
ncbi:MAG: enoyl-CoA hydratase/isomerase family protein [Proteobacteria bacterium]|nr:enoyl-CoA hydratase/isomerase family protein [Pseudomonadota bacterium]